MSLRSSFWRNRAERLAERLCSEEERPGRGVEKALEGGEEFRLERWQKSPREATDVVREAFFFDWRAWVAARKRRLVVPVHFVDPERAEQTTATLLTSM